MAVVAIFTTSPVAAKKSKKKKLVNFESDNVRCLVCQSVADEFLVAINRVDPKKKTETGTFRIDAKGNQKKNLVPYARSQEHLMDLTEKLCDAFEDYVQAKWKSSGEPTVIRLTTPEGNMNPRFTEVDIEPDEDLNTKLKFYCRSVVEDQEDHFMELLPNSENDSILREEICVNRSKLCKTVAKRDEL